MKTAGIFLASILSAIPLSGCDFLQYPEDPTEPESGPPPMCTVTSIIMESAALTSSRGGDADMRLTIYNSPGCATAYNIHADVVAEQGAQRVGEASVDFDFLDGGESTGTSLDFPVTGLPDGAFCTLSWYDEAGNAYSAIANITWNGGFFLSTPRAGK